MTLVALAADIAVSERPFDELLSEAVAFHRHLCPGVVPGTRMATIERSRVRVFCDACGEGINRRREVSQGARTLRRPCAGDSYYSRAS